MLVRRPQANEPRRGIVLILILAMLGLLALVGVSFATFSGQAAIGARKYAEGASLLESEQLMDFALSQLINGTHNPLSAIRGHDLKRDMFGNDAVNNGLLRNLPNGNNIFITNASFNSTTGLIDCLTNVPSNGIPGLYGLNFGRWNVKIARCAGYDNNGDPINPIVPPIMQTYEVIKDVNQGGVHLISLAPISDQPTSNSNASLLTALFNPLSTTPTTLAVGATPFIAAQNGLPILLDGRRLRAFNGPGLMNTFISNVPTSPYPVPAATYGNFLYNGGLQNGNPLTIAPGNPDLLGMDEDYDAPDLENWYLALQSADGQVTIPSFHRPGILRAVDWTSQTPDSKSRILRPRAADLNDPDTFPDLIPNGSGQIAYDVDNDGDGIADSVWVDLGFPPQKDSSGRLYKPLFSLMVLGLNGRLPLNTAGNLSALQSYSVVDPNTGALLTPAVGTPLFTHASSHAYSVNELNPLYALQNSSFGIGSGTLLSAAQLVNSPLDNANVPVDITQLRNLLTGTRPQDPGAPSNYANPYWQGPFPNGDANLVTINGTPVLFPNNVPDANDQPTGNTTFYRGTNSVAGRWGEGDYVPRYLNTTDVFPFNNLIRAGRSHYLMYPQAVQDATDDDFTAIDFGASGGGVPENGDIYEGLPPFGTGSIVTGSVQLPSERTRKFVAPIDVSGNGQIRTWHRLPLGPFDYGLGADDFGRVAPFQFYRPPGVPPVTLHLNGWANPPTTIAPAASSGNANYPNPNLNANGNYIGDLASNRYHGYESQRNPSIFGTNNPSTPFGAQAMFAAMPFDNGGPLVIPSFVGPINSTPIAPAPIMAQNPNANPPYMGAPYPPRYQTPVSNNPTVNNYALGSLGRDQSDEMNLYRSNDSDAAFGPSDLEWLYRLQDVDGTSLSSRLSQLAPISFLNPNDGLTRRRLFSDGSWDTVNYAFAPDNPGNSFPFNSRFGAGQNGGFTQLSANTQASTGNPNAYLAAPALGHRDRKINLNVPLPVSNSPLEPVRQKWIRETYVMLKSILPPEAVDTPQELAELSQFVVNIIDFRDPDCATTVFVNTDLLVTLDPANQNPPTLAFNGSPPADPYDPNYYVNPPATGNPYLVQFGMEYSPVALNEILAFQFFRNTNYNQPSPNTAVSTPRMFVELVNRLTQANPIAGRTDASDLDLYGWEFVLLPDNSVNNRPHPITGQTTLPVESYTRVVVMNGNQIAPGTQLTTNLYGAGQNNSNPSSPYPVPALQASSRNPDPQANAVGVNGITTSYYYVIANQYPQSPSIQANDENNPPTVAPPNGTPTPKADGQVALEFPNWNLLQKDGLGNPLKTGQYYWLYLTRPTNPLDPTSPKVVVDSFRFPYTDAGYTVKQGNANAPVVVSSAQNPPQALYSLERIQPYRGGQAVPYAVSGTPTALAPIPPTCYGYREQTIPSTSQAINGTGSYQGYYSYYTTVAGKQVLTQLQSTNIIYQSLGYRNSTTEPSDLMPFHDRDFTSAAELLLVPGCPPGLFTKQFAENSPPIRIPTAAYAYVTPPANYPGQNGGTNDNRNVGQTLRPPHVLAYLPDNFYYTAYGRANDSAAAPLGFGGPVIGGPTGAGWHRMFGFLEVPSSSQGATGTVGLGHDFDWYRQDRRPGLVNLNLMIDEETFFGVLDDPVRMNLNPFNNPNPTFNPGPLAVPPYYPQNASGNVIAPNIVTMINLDGSPATSYPMNGRGFTYWMGVDPLSVSNPTLPAGSFINGGAPYPKMRPNLPNDQAVVGMKAAFADFLRLRHGGSNFLYGYGVGPTISAVYGPGNGPIPADRPFHDITFPDINFTVMRPATLPPSANTNPPQTYPYSATYPQTAATPPMPPPPTPNGPLPTVYYAQDPGLKNPYVAQPMPTVATAGTQYAFQPPAVPPRRLFQIPDSVPSTSPGPPPLYQRDNASVTGDPNINNPVLLQSLADPTVNLSSSNTQLGVSLGIGLGAGNSGNNDRRTHPQFRTEWMQKIMNLTTVRTHQYATWITVGFFEVVRQGDPQHIDPVSGLLAPIPDVLGREIGALEGKNIRFRSFFVIDRSQAIGFNPADPGDFRDLITYRRRIE